MIYNRANCGVLVCISTCFIVQLFYNLLRYFCTFPIVLYFYAEYSECKGDLTMAGESNEICNTSRETL